MAFSHDEKRLAVVHHDAKAGTTSVGIWDIATGRPGPVFQSRGSHAFEVAFSPNDRHLAIGGNEGVLLVWDLETPDKHLTLRGHKDGIRRLGFSSDGQRLASAASDGTIRIWDVRSVE